MAALIGRFEFLFLELLSIKTCVNTYVSAGEHVAQSAPKPTCPKHFVQAMEPLQHFRIFLSTCFGHFDSSNNFMDKKLCPFLPGQHVELVSSLIQQQDGCLQMVAHQATQGRL